MTLKGASPSTATVTVNTAGNLAGLTQPTSRPSASSPLGLWAVFFGLGVTPLIGVMRYSRGWRPQLLYGLMLLSLLSAGISMSACGGGNNGARGGGGTPLGNYTLTVTGSYTSGSTTLTHNTKLTLVVQ
jgi:hypothetical protein